MEKIVEGLPMPDLNLDLNSHPGTALSYEPSIIFIHFATQFYHSLSCLWYLGASNMTFPLLNVHL